MHIWNCIKNILVKNSCEALWSIIAGKHLIGFAVLLGCYRSEIVTGVEFNLRSYFRSLTRSLPVHLLLNCMFQPRVLNIFEPGETKIFRNSNQVELLKFWTSSVFSIFCSFSCSIVYFAVLFCILLLDTQPHNLIRDRDSSLIRPGTKIMLEPWLELFNQIRNVVRHGSDIEYQQ